MAKVKTYIAQTMRANAINIFEIDENLESFSADICARLVPDFLDYGVQLKRFYVTTIVKPDGDPQYEKFKDCLLYTSRFGCWQSRLNVEKARKQGNFANGKICRRGVFADL